MTVSPSPTLPEIPGVPGTTPPTTPSAPDPTGTGSPSETPPTSPSPSGTPDTATGPDSVVSAQGVMVTPKPPSAATYAYGPAARQRIDAYWRPVPGAKPARKPKRKADIGQRSAGAQQAGAQPAKPAAPKVKPRPAVLVLHGGYWLEGDKSGWKYFARRLTNQGFAVFAANYRLAGSAQWPAQRNDALASIEFIKKHAKKWNVDPARIVVMGSSAGGMLATQAGAYGTGGQRVRGVIALSPVNTPFLAYQDGDKATATPGQRKLKRAVVDLIRCVPLASVASCWKRVDDSNSASHASAGDAPMLLMHSVGDFVPATHSTGLAVALRGAGVPATVRTVPGKMHGPSLMNDEHVYPTILNWLKAHTR